MSVGETVNHLERWFLSIDELTLNAIDYVNRWVQMYLHINRMIIIGIFGLVGVHGTISFMVHSSASTDRILVEWVVFILASFFCLVLFVVACLALLLGAWLDPPYSQHGFSNKPRGEQQRWYNGILVVATCFSTPLLLAVAQWGLIWWMSFPLLVHIVYLFHCSDINPEDRVRLFGSREAKQNS